MSCTPYHKRASTLWLQLCILCHQDSASTPWSYVMHTLPQESFNILASTMYTLPSRLGLNTLASWFVYLALKTRPQDRHATTSKPGNKAGVPAKNEVSQYAETTMMDTNKTAEHAEGTNEPNDDKNKKDNGLATAGASHAGENTNNTRTEDTKLTPHKQSDSKCRVSGSHTVNSAEFQPRWTL